MLLFEILFAKQICYSIWIVGCMIWLSNLLFELLDVWSDHWGDHYWDLAVGHFLISWSENVVHFVTADLAATKFLYFFASMFCFWRYSGLLVWFINSKHVNGWVFCHLNGSYDIRSGFRVSFVWRWLLSRLGSDIIELDIKGTGKFTRDVVLECITLCLALFVLGPLYVKLQ